MSADKKILIVYPHNFIEKGSGVNKRYFELVSWLKEQGFSIDLLALRHFQSSWEKGGIGKSPDLIDRLFLYDFRIGFHRHRFSSFFSRLNFFSNNGKRSLKSKLPDYAFPAMITLFKKIVARNKYDFIVIGYVYWANLIRDNTPPGVVTVLTMEDFISTKVHERNQSLLNIQDLIDDEVERIDLFDKVLCLSHEELAFFSTKALQPEYFFVPVFMDKPKTVHREKVYDILFIGFDNEDNIEGLAWFFSNVHPLMAPGVKIVVVGKVARYAPDLPGVTKEEFIPDLGEIYAKSKVAINPLLKGTGMKVKVVESLAYGIPMVNTSRGLCGIPPEILGKFILADDPQLFAKEIERLLTDTKWYSDRCSDAEETFESYFSVGAAGKELYKIFS